MRAGSMVIKWAATGLAMSLVGAACSDSALACENGVGRRIMQQSRDLVAAETNVQRGRSAKAAWLVLRHHPTIRTRRVGASPSGDMALRLMARAVVRSDGALPAGSPFAGETPKQRASNIAWAVSIMRRFVGRNHRDARAITNLGEALAAVPKHRREAIERLEAMEKADLMSSAHGYAALARLRRDVGPQRPAWLRHALRALSDARAGLAEARCRKMSPVPTICGSPAEEKS